MQTQPTIATTQQLNGTSYAVLMIDMDIPTNNPPETSTLLHWMQTGLTPATASTSVNSTTASSAMSVFLLQNTSNTAAFAPYLGPGPPARVPLSHRYVQILVDTTNAPQTALESLQTAAQNRSGFNAEATLKAAGLDTMVIAGNFYNVTNPGPATNAAASTTIGGSSNRGSASAGTVTTGAASRDSLSTSLVMLFSVAMLFLAF